MSLLLKMLGGSGQANTPNVTVPSGTPSVQIISDNVLVANNVTLTGGWFGRTAMKRVSSNYWVMVYREAESHGTNTYGKIHVKFTTDNGDTWTTQNINIEGSAVSGMPIYPTGGAPGDLAGPGEPWLYLAPNGDLILHMWKSQYGATGDATWGTWQSVSSDGGRTWSTPTQVDFVGIANDQRIFATDDDFVLNEVIYAGIRIYATDEVSLAYGIKSALIKSTDNGQTWQYVSDITTIGVTDTTEFGIEYVGNNTIVAFMRDANRVKTYLVRSTDLGLTWGTIQEIQSTVGATGRQRIYTRSHLKNTIEWWKDPVLICQGFEFPTPGDSHPRRIAVWISKDSGITWSAPLYIRISGYDGGYGDILYNPVKDEFVTTMYYAPTSLYDGEIRQINWKLIWS